MLLGRLTWQVCIAFKNVSAKVLTPPFWISESRCVMALVYWGSSISLLTSSFSAQCSELPLLALSLSLCLCVSLLSRCLSDSPISTLLCPQIEEDCFLSLDEVFPFLFCGRTLLPSGETSARTVCFPNPLVSPLVLPTPPG